MLKENSVKRSFLKMIFIHKFTIAKNSLKLFNENPDPALDLDKRPFEPKSLAEMSGFDAEILSW